MEYLKFCTQLPGLASQLAEISPKIGTQLAPSVEVISAHPLWIKVKSYQKILMLSVIVVLVLYLFGLPWAKALVVILIVLLVILVR